MLKLQYLTSLANRFAVLILLSLLSIQLHAQLPGYAYYNILTIQNSQVIGAGSHANFPVLISHIDPDLATTGNGGFVENANGYDISFTASDGITLLDHQIEAYNPVTGEIAIWVRIPSLSTSANTDIRMYYGNSSISVDPSVTSVWDNNYQGVWHLDATDFDATVNTNHLTAGGTSNLAGSIIADGQSFSTNDVMNGGVQAELQIHGDLTVESWVNFNSIQAGTTDNSIMGCGMPGNFANENHAYKLNLTDASLMRAFWEHGVGNNEFVVSTVAAPVVLGTWHHMAFVRDATAQTVTFYFDGNQLGTPAGYTFNTDNGALAEFFLGEGFTNWDLDGDLDEPRVSDIIRSPDWLSTSYNSMNSPATFYTIGARIMSGTTPDWCYAQDILGSNNNQILDIATQPSTGISYAVGYFNNDLSSEFTQGYNFTPDMATTLGTQDGLVVKYDQSGNYIWAFKIGAPSSNVSITGVEVGPAGNIYVTGHFDDDCEFQGVSTSPLASIVNLNGDNETFIASYDSDGNLLWVTKGVNPGDAQAMDIAVNGTHVFTTGFFENTLTVTGGAGITSNDGTDTYILAYTLAGTFAWESHAGNVSGCCAGANDQGWAIAADNSSVYVTGYFPGTIEFNSTPATQVASTTPGIRSIFVSEFTAAGGAFVWADKIGTTADSESHGIAIDANNMYITGGIEGNVAFPGLAPFLVPGSGQEIFVCGIDRTTHNTLWNYISENNSGTDVSGEDIIVDVNGDVIYTGHFLGTTQFGGGSDPKISTGNEDLFVSSYTAAGTYNYTQVATDGSDVRGNGLAYDDLGAIYVGGRVENEATFSPLPLLGDAGSDDGFIAKLNCTTCDATMTYGQAIYCTLIDADPTPGGTYDAGSVFTSTPAGLSLNAGDGTINLGASADGVYTITCTSPNNCTQLSVITIETTCWNWADGPESVNTEAGHSIDVDETNQLVYVGGVLESAGVYPSIGAGDVLGGTDGFLAQYDFNGVLQWAINLGGDLEDEVTGVAVDQITGLVYVTGNLEGNFGLNGTDISGVSGGGGNILTNAGNEDFFIACYNSAGVLQWFETGGGTDDDGGLDVAINTQGVYVVGYYDDQATFDSGSETTDLPANGATNGFVASYDLAGAGINWLAEIGSGGNDLVITNDQVEFDWGISADNSQVYIIQSFNGSDDAQIWDKTSSQVGAATHGTNGEDIVVVAFHNDGSYVWNQVYDNDMAQIYGMDIGSDCDGVYVSATVHTPTTTPSGHVISFGHDSPFLAQLDKNTGDENWVIDFDSDDDHGDVIMGVYADGYGNIYTIGRMTSDPFFVEPPLNVYKDSGATTQDVFIMRYDNLGNFQDFERLDGTGTDGGTDIVVYQNTDIFVTGQSDDNTTFYPGGITSLSNENIFVGRRNIAPLGAYCCPGPTITACQANDTVTADAFCDHLLGDYTGAVSAVDNCGLGLLPPTQTPAIGTTLSPGTHQITLTVTDGGGNFSNCIFDLVVEADINPTVLNCGDVLTGETTNGGQDNGNAFPCAPGSTTGEDVYYQIDVPAGNYLLYISMEVVSDANDPYANVFWMGAGCPLGGGCLQADSMNVATDQFSNGQGQLSFAAAGPGTYYFVVDSRTDHIDDYTIKFDCQASVIEFDESSCPGDPDGDGLTAEVNGGATLEVTPCETEIICHDFYIMNVNGAEWLDSLSMELGPCYTNITAISPDNPPGGNGDIGAGDWSATYDNPTNTIIWEFENSSNPAWGDGNTSFFGCELHDDFCFTADIAAGCNDANDLDITVTISDDGVPGSGGNTTPGVDFAFSDNFILVDPLPTISCPANVSVNNTGGSCAATVGSIAPTASGDNCPGFVITHVLSGATTGSGGADASGTSFNVGVTTVTYTITDNNSQTATCSFTVTVIDNENPTITCPADQTGNVDALCDFSIPNYTGLATGLTDNCTAAGSIVVTQSPVLGTIVGVGTTTITLTATDGAGNSANCTFDVVITDNTPPSISCPANQTGNVDASCLFSLPNYTTFATGLSDNCTVPASIVVTQSPAIGSNVGTGTTTITLTATDGAGNTANCTFDVVVTDNIPPTISCPVNQTGNLDASCDFSIPNYTGLATGLTDNCTANASIVVTQSPVLGTIVGAGTTTITLTATDAAGNTANCNFDVVVTDNIPPTISCPTNQTGNVNATCNFTLLDYTGMATGLTDNCTAPASIVVTQSPAIGSNVGIGTTTITLTATDGAGNVANCTFDVVVTDNIPPSISCPANQTGNVGASCLFSLPDFTGLATGLSDNCTVPGSIVVTQSPAIGSNVGIGTTTITLTATDGAGNTANCNFDVVVTDNTPPTISCPANQTANVDATCNFAIPNYTGLATGLTDNCTVPGSIVVTQSPVIGTNVGTGTTTITLTATDGSGNTTNCTFDVVVADNTPPTISCPPNQTGNVDASCNFSIPNYTGLATGLSDNCTVPGSIVVTQSPVLGTNVGTGTTTITLTATDGAGNTANCNFDVVVSDNIPPTISCPSNVIGNTTGGACSAIVNLIGPTASNDNCTSTITHVLTGVTTGSGGADASGTVFNLGVTTVSYTITDGASQTASCNFTVTIVDNEDPTITCPANQVGFSNGVCNYTLLDYTGLASGLSDNCTPTGSIVVTQSPAMGTNVGVGNTTVTLTATDGAGNTGTCTFDVVVSDIFPPTISCPANQTGNVDASCNFVLPNYTGLATAADNCTATASIVVTQSPAVGTNLGVGTTTITLTATDGSGNTANCTFDVVITDNTPPTIACPANQVGNVDASCLFTIPNYTGLATGVADNCTAVGSIVVTQSPVLGTNVGVGTTTITLTASDGTGNSSNCTFDVVVTDNIPPTITCPANQTGNVNATCNFALPDYTTLATGLTDNCTAPGSIVVTQSPAIGSNVGTGTTTITLTAIDGSGNTANCTFDVVVTDNTPPSITCPANQTANVDASCLFSLPDYTGLASGLSDNCTVPGSIVVTQIPAIGTNVGTGTNTITLTATDASGNTANCTFDVVVTDITPPTITCPSNQTGSVNASCNFVLPNYTGLATGLSDNCTPTGSIVVNQSPAIGTSIGTGTTTITLTATDGAGNSASCTFDVVVTDNILPTNTCPPNQTGNVNASCDFVLPDYTGLAAPADNCPGVLVTQNPAIGTTVGVGTTTITLTATDASGNTASCTFDVVVADNIPPTISCPANQVGNVDASCNFALPDYTALATSLSDNCTAAGAIVVTQSPTIGTNVGTGTTTITLTATDGAGNMANCTFDVVVTDLIPPTITCPANQTGNVNTSCNFALPDYTGLATGLSDNCTPAGSIIVTQSPNIGTNVGTGTTTITLTASDAVGNTAICTFDVVVTDLIAPTIICPASQTANVDASCNFVIPDYTGLASSADNCPNGVVVTQSPVIGTNVGTGTTTITLTATDGAGNTSNCTFDLVVTDIIPPTITCPTNQTANVNASCNFVLPDYTPLASPMDNCPGVVVTQSPSVGTNIGTGTTTITLTATDAAGLTATCTFDVVVTDVTPPTITCPVNQTAYADASCNFSLIDYTGLATATDNCPGVVVTQTPGIGANVGTGTTTITLTATDAAGLTAPCTFDVVILDTISPTFTSCPVNFTQCDSIVSWTAPVATDNCSSATINQIAGPSSGSTFPVGITTVVFEASDVSGNTTLCTFDVTILPPLNPIFWLPDTICLNGAGAIDLDDSTQLNASIPETDLFYSDSSQVQISGSNNFIPQATGPGIFPITHVVDNGFCTDTLVLTVVILPNYNPNFMNVDTICAASDTVDLNLFFNAGTSIGGVWTVNNGANVIPDSLWVVSLASGSYDMTYTVGAGQCADSSTQTLHVSYDADPSWGMSPDTVCDSEDLIDLLPLISGSFDGTSIFQGSGVTGTDFDPTIGPGLHYITYSVGESACLESLMDSIFILTTPIVDAGPDIEVCGDSAILNGLTDAPSWYWTSPSGLIMSDSLLLTNIQFNTLSGEGLHQVYLVVDNGYCSVKDSTTIDYYFQPTLVDAGADQELDYQFESTMDALWPDYGSGYWSIVSDGSIANPNLENSSVSDLVLGENILYWVVENGPCPVDSASVIITVNDLFIPQGFSPNDDLLNDVFEIPGIENAQSAELKIFNRWGNVVYENDNYLNDWSGNSSNGDQLANDTYFYILVVDNDREFAGYVIINR